MSEKYENGTENKMSSYLVDTDILIDISKEKEEALQLLEELGRIKISIITAMELLMGARNRNEIEDIEEFLSVYEKVHLDKEICTKAYELLKKYAKEHGLSIPDSLISATAILNNFVLVTRNTKHFTNIKELSLKEPDYS